MTYATKDKSVQDGSPIECYKFVGTFDTYRYTDSPVEVVVNNETYEPLPIQRGVIEEGSIIDDAAGVDIAVPFDSDLARDYVGPLTPEKLTIEIRRVHRDDDWATDWKMIWNGVAIGYGSSGLMFSISTISNLQAKLHGGVNSVYYQTTCNNVLYDDRCQISRSAFTTTSTVTAVSDTAVTVDDDGFNDHALSAGEAVNNRTGERRLILDNLANVVDIGYPFIDCKVGDSISLTAGCDHSFSTCNVKFDNIVHFTGFMYIPTKNPFEDGI